MKKLLHREAVATPNLKIISIIIKLSESLDEELFSKAKNKFYTPDEFNNALKNMNMASQFFMHCNMFSLFYHHLEWYNLISTSKIRPNIIRISKATLRNGKEPITNNFLPNYVHEHTSSESKKKDEHFYI